MTGRGLKDKIDKVMNRHGSGGVSAVYCAVNTHIKEINLCATIPVPFALRQP